MRHFNKKLLPMLLVLALFFGMVPGGSINAYAEGGPDPVLVGTPGALEAALTAVPFEGTIKLTANISYTKGIYITSKNFTLDLNGYTLDVVNSEDQYSRGLSAALSTLKLIGEGNFNVTGTYYGLDASNHSDITVTNATATANNGIGAYADTNGKITINGNAKGNESGVTASGSKAKILVKGNVISEFPYSYGGWAARAGNGGEITIKGNATGVAGGLHASSNNGSRPYIEILGDVKATSSNGIGVSVVGSAEVVVEGKITAATYIQSESSGSKVFTESDITLPTTKPGYHTYQHATNEVWVKIKTSNVCEIGDIQYATLADALTAVQNGQTINILKNAAHNGGIEIDGKTVTFAIGNNKLSVVGTPALVTKNGGEALFNGKVCDFHGGIIAEKNSRIELISGMVWGGTTVLHANGGVIVAAGNITVASGTQNGALAENGGEIEIHGNVDYYLNSNANETGVLAKGMDSLIKVSGDIAINSANPNAYGACAEEGGQVIVAGIIDAPADKYIEVDGVVKGKGNQDADSTRVGYLTYTGEQGSVVWVKADPVCSIGETQYATLDEALIAVQTGKTIRLMQNINYNKGIVIDGKAITFDVGSFILDVITNDQYALHLKNSGEIKLVGTGEFNVTSEYGSSGYGVYSTGASTVTVSNATANGSGGVGAFADTSGEIVVNKNVSGGVVGALAQGSGSSVVVGGNARTLDGVGCGASVYGGGSVTIDGIIHSVKYVKVQAIDLKITDKAASTTKDGYHTYTVSDSTSVVWVKIPPPIGDTFTETNEGVPFKYGILTDETSSHTVEVITNSSYIDHTTLKVPQTVTHEATTYTVISIGNQAFNDCQVATSIIIPHSITNIGDYAFQRCKALTDFEIPSSVRKIGKGAFSGCPKLKEVTFLPQTPPDFGSNAFPAGVNTIYVPIGCTANYLPHTEEDCALAGAQIIELRAYNLNVNGSYAATTGTESYLHGATVTINAGARSGYSFAGWSSPDVVTFINKNSATTTFTMPAKDATVTALWNYNGGGHSGTTTNDYVQGKYIVEQDKEVDIDLTRGSTLLSAAQLQSLIEQNATKPVILIDENYTLVFQIGTMKVVAGQKNIDFGARFNTGTNYNKIKAIAGNNLTLMISYNHSGKLPAEATITIKVGPEYTGQNLYYYYYNTTSRELEYLQSVRVTADGYATVQQGRCSDYAFLAEKLGSKPVENINNIIKLDTKAAVNTNINALVPYLQEDNQEIIVKFSAMLDGMMHLIDNNKTGYIFKQATNDFSDTISHWAKDDIDFVTARGLFSGTSSGNFSPNATMTRGMFVTVLGRLWDANVSEFTATRFDDVKETSYYAPYVEWAAAQGIVSGIGDNKFAPTRAISREEMAVIIANFVDFTKLNLNINNNNPTAFIDAQKISSCAQGGVSIMQKSGVISGNPGNIFAPKNAATRAETATMLRKLIENIVE